MKPLQMPKPVFDRLHTVNTTLALTTSTNILLQPVCHFLLLSYACSEGPRRPQRVTAAILGTVDELDGLQPQPPKYQAPAPVLYWLAKAVKWRSMQ